MIDVIQFVRDRLIDELREPTWKLVIGLDPEPTRDLTGEPKPLIKIIVTTPPHLVSGYPLVCSTTLDARATIDEEAVSMVAHELRDGIRRLRALS
jgi:hypothetical protein